MTLVQGAACMRFECMHALCATAQTQAETPAERHQSIDQRLNQVWPHNAATLSAKEICAVTATATL